MRYRIFGDRDDVCVEGLCRFVAGAAETIQCSGELPDPTEAIEMEVASDNEHG